MAKKHDIIGKKIQVETLENKDGKIVSITTIQYSDARLLDDLDLVYWGFIKDSLGGGVVIQNGTITPNSTVAQLNAIADGTDEAKPGTMIYRDFGIEGVLIWTKLNTNFWTRRTEAKANA